MKRIKGVFLAQWWANWPRAMLFWGVFAGYLAIHYLLLHVILKDWIEGDNQNALNVVVLVFFMVTGSLLVGKMLPMTLSLSGTRFQYIAGTTLFLLAFAAANSLLMVLLGVPEVRVLSNEDYRLWINFADLHAVRPEAAWFVQTLLLFAFGMLFAVLSALRLRAGIPVYLSAIVLLGLNLSIPALRDMWRWIVRSLLDGVNLLPLSAGLLAAGAALVLAFWALLARVALKASHANAG